MGTFDFIEGEQARIRVTLATGISAERCAAHNLNYRDPLPFDPQNGLTVRGDVVSDNYSSIIRNS